MDISKILDYQKLDTELFKLEKRLRDNPNKKTANEMSTNAKNAQQLKTLLYLIRTLLNLLKA